MIYNKKALSPVIATILLVVITIALFLLVFMWIKGFQKEAILKFGVPVETSCFDVSFDARVSGNQIQIINTGNLPINRFQIDCITPSGTQKISSDQSQSVLLAGSNSILTISCDGTKIRLIPFLLGKTESGTEKEYVCEKQSRIYSI